MPRILVLCPTFDHADALFASIASVRAQTVTDWELAVICDGAPERTHRIVETMAGQDPRIGIHRHPKDPVRFGELHRDPVIRASDAEFVCHLSDDDIWAPDHLEAMTALLAEADWGNQAPLQVETSGRLEWLPMNHGTPAARSDAIARFGLSVGLNFVGYRRAAYLRLPEGWTSAPPEANASDQYMWAKFMAAPDIRIASTARSTALKLPSRKKRRDFTPEMRLAELGPWLARIGDPGLLPRLRRKADIRQRVGRLFALHAAERAASLDEAFALAGFSPAAEDVEPRPALAGAPMVTPLTDRQRETAWQCWAMLRIFVAGIDDQREPLARAVTADGSVFRGAVKALGTDHPAAALAAIEAFGNRLADPTLGPRLATRIRARIAATAPTAAAGGTSP